MKNNLLVILLLFISQLSFSQVDNKFDWELQNSNTKIHLNHSDIGIWVKELDTIMDQIPSLKIVADKNSEFVKANFISFERGKGALLKIDIQSNHDIIGNNKLLIVNENENSIIGHFVIPIGSDDPIIDAYNSRGELLVGGEFKQINLIGINLDGVTEIITDGKIIINEIDTRKRNNEVIPLQMKANFNDYLTGTNFRCKYLEFDPASKTLVEKLTPFFTTNIGIYKSSIIELKPSQKDFYVTDILKNGGNLKLKVLKNDFMVESVDFQNLRIVPQEIIGQGSWIRLSNSNEGELNLNFIDVKSLEGENVFIEFDLQGTNQKYRVGFNLLPEPIITTVENNNGDQKYIINKDIEQLIIVKGSNVDKISVVPVRTDLFEVIYRGAVPSEKEFLLKLNSDDFAPRSFNFKLLRDDNVLKTFSLTFEEPRIPQKANSLFTLKQGTNVYPADGSPATISINSKSENITLTLDPALLKDGYGKQSYNIKVNYYNTDNSLISSVDVLNNGSSEIVIREGGRPFIVELNIMDNFNDYIRPWGRAEIVISHTADFYKQQLDLKEVFLQRINFIGKSRTSVTASLTIPPALMIYGKDSEHRLELLPINVGFGINFSFRKDESHSYAKRNFELGAYFAGLNFAGTSNSEEQNEGDNKFINKGDIAFMALGQFNLRRTDNFVKIPILFGPGFTFPINGATSRGFLAFGVGINF